MAASASVPPPLLSPSAPLLPLLLVGGLGSGADEAPSQGLLLLLLLALRPPPSLLLLLVVVLPYSAGHSHSPVRQQSSGITS